MIPSLFPNDLQRLPPLALSLLFKTWILRSLSVYVRDCLDVVGYDAAGSLLRTTLRNTSPGEFDPVAVGSLLARAWALCEERERLRNLEDVRDQYEGVWERELARRALNDSITDVGFLAAIAITPFGSSVEFLEQARLVAWIGIEQTVIAGELISPGIVFFEKVTREREARTQVTLKRGGPIENAVYRPPCHRTTLGTADSRVVVLALTPRNRLSRHPLLRQSRRLAAIYATR